jgi:hypothetical protein
MVSRSMAQDPLVRRQPHDLGRTLTRPSAKADTTLCLTVACSIALASAPVHAQHGDGPLNEASYRIEARITGPRTIEATERIRWVHRSDSRPRALEWHLYANAFERGSLFLRTLSGGAHRGNAPGAGGSITVHSIALSSGEELLPGATQEFEDRAGVGDDRTRLRTPLPASVERDAPLEIVVRFSVLLPDAFSRSGCGDRFCFAGQWFPKLAVLERDGRWNNFALHAQSEFFADFGRYELTIDAPRAAVVFATGHASPVQQRGDRAIHRFVLGRAHDCAFGWSERATRRAVTIGAPRVRDGDEQTEPRAVELVSVSTSSDEVVAERAVALARQALPVFERRFGPYPYDSLTVVVAPRDAVGLGGMEYPGLITVEANPSLPRFVRSIEYVTAHELAHQWFYGVIASDEHAHPVLDEGLAEYATGVVLDELYGAPAFGHIGAVGFGFWAMQGAFASLDQDEGPLVREASRFANFDSYAALVYRRASATLATLERHQPQRFERLLREYATRQRFRHPGPEDLLATLSVDSSSRALADRLLRPALFGRSSSNLRVESLSADRAVLVRDGDLSPTVSVETQHADGSIHRRAWDTSERRLELRAPLRSVSIDPSPSAHMAERSRVDNARTLSGPGLSPLSARLANVFALLLRWLGP